MKTTSHGKPFCSGFLSFCVSLLLTAALTTPAPATVFTNSAPINLPNFVFIGEGNPYPSNIKVPNLGGNIAKITVTLHNFNHTRPDDLDILLVGPVTSDNIILMSDAGGIDDKYNIDITFDDNAGGNLPDTMALPSPSGTFKPTNFDAGDAFPFPAPSVPSANTTLSAFNGTNPAGTWSLYVVDDQGGDIGTIGNGWSLTITAAGNDWTLSSTKPIHSGDGQRGRGSPYGSPIKVTGMAGAITDVNVTVSGLTHFNPDDVDILLVGPSGKRVLLLSDAGGAKKATNINMTFDDAAVAVAPDLGPLFTGTFKPTNFGLGDTLPYLPVIYPSPLADGPSTLESVYNGTKPNGTWRLYVVDDGPVFQGNIAGGWSIDITAGGIYGASRFTNTDFDGDGLSDTAVYRPLTNSWYLRDSSTTNKRGVGSFTQPGDIPVPGYYDGDGITDLALYRPGLVSQWQIRLSGASAPLTLLVNLGTIGDIPVPQDYDGNGFTDVGVFGPSGIWTIKPGATPQTVAWGAPGDIPVRGHFFGTDGADFAFFHPQDGTWHILSNDQTHDMTVPWGLSSDKPVPGDYDGDGKTDIAVYRPSDSTWYIMLSSAGAMYAVRYGLPGDTPVPGDYDGDKKTDIAVWRGSGPDAGAWYIQNSGVPFGADGLEIDIHGDPNDIPIAKYYLP